MTFNPRLFVNIVFSSAFIFTAMPSSAEDERQWIGVSTYQLVSEEAAAVFDKAFAAFVPGLKAQGISPVGVFQVTETKPEDPGILRYVVVPVDDPVQFTNLGEGLSADSAIMEAAMPYLSAEKDAPAIKRIDSVLLYAMSGMPKLEVPGKAEPGKPRLFELRTYESHSEVKGKLKVLMFNEAEMAIFKEVGFGAVFFGEAIAGGNLPQLTYMLAYNDEDDSKAAWKRFSDAESWKKLRVDERFKDTVSKIISRFLKPLPYSGIQ